MRGRCGNRVSWTPRVPVLPAGEAEPQSAELITPSIRGESFEELPVPPIIAELLPSALPPKGLPPGIIDPHPTALPSFIGGFVAPGHGGAASGGGSGGGGGGVFPGSAVDHATYLTGGPVVLIPWFMPPVPGLPSAPGFPGIPSSPPSTSIAWNRGVPNKPSQIFAGQPWLPPGRPLAPTTTWNPPNPTPLPWSPVYPRSTDPQWDPPANPPTTDLPPVPPPAWWPENDPQDWPPRVPRNEPHEPGDPPFTNTPEPGTLLTTALSSV